MNYAAPFQSGPLEAGTATFAGEWSRLPKESVYRSVTGREEFFAFYDMVCDRLPDTMRATRVMTRYGETHVTFGGTPGKKPLLVLPGMSIAGPMMLEFFDYLWEDRLLIAPDLVGQPGLSADRIFNPADNAFGKWAVDMLDGLEIERIDIAGASFGGAIGLDLAMIAPERVGKLGLIVTAGLTPRLPYLQIYASMFFSWMTYRYLPVKSLLPAIARPLSRGLTADNLDYLDLIIRQTAFWRHRPAGPFAPADLKDKLEPVFITFSQNDILFPFATTRPHAHKTVPIAEEHVLTGSAHMPSAADVEPVHDALRAYFAHSVTYP
jgi:pimeloyl-ACP methyl ester carboxylesterase